LKYDEWEKEDKIQMELGARRQRHELETSLSESFRLQSTNKNK